MHPRLREIVDLLAAHRLALRAAVDAVPVSLRETPPGPDRWSVAEVLEHLGLVEQRVTQALSTRFAAAKAAGLSRETDARSALATFDPARVRDRSNPFKSGEGSRPKAGLDAPSAWEALERSRVALAAFIAEADGYALGEIVFPHPMLGPLDGYQWIAFLGGHELRHGDQIREAGRVLEKKERPAPPAI